MSSKLQNHIATWHAISRILYCTPTFPQFPVVAYHNTSSKSPFPTLSYLNFHLPILSPKSFTKSISVPLLSPLSPYSWRLLTVSLLYPIYSFPCLISCQHLWNINLIVTLQWFHIILRTIFNVVYKPCRVLALAYFSSPVQKQCSSLCQPKWHPFNSYKYANMQKAFYVNLFA